MRYITGFFRSMAGRVFLVLLVGTWLALALSVWIASLQGESNIAQVRGRVAADRLAHWLTLADALPPGQRAMAVRLAEREGVHLVLGRLLPTAPTQHLPALRAQLQERLDPGLTLLNVAQNPEGCAPEDLRPDGRCAVPRRLIAHARLGDGTPVTVDIPEIGPRRHPLPFFERFAVQMGIFAFALMFLAGGVAYWVARPLRTMSRAALSLGHNIAQPPLPENGPAEVRDAARSFNRMQALIRRHVEERTGMLSAITHDLQTPLTRMRLRLENAPADPLKERLLEDLEEMRLMIRDGLDLARSLDAPPPSQPLRLDSLVESVCADQAEGGDDVRFSGHSDATVLARSMDLRRALANLLANAVKYGGHADVRVSREGNEAVIRVTDGGPGIPEDQLDRVMEPFVRLETSRSRETGGTGLGLAIARNIVRAHGGALSLRNAPAGGLEAELRLPLAL